MNLSRIIGLVLLGIAFSWLSNSGVDQAEAKVKCRDVAARPYPSAVSAVRMPCSKARKLVRYTTFHNRRAPEGWVYVNPGGCEGFIVRKRHVKYMLKHGYRFKPGTKGVTTVIYRGCTS